MEKEALKEMINSTIVENGSQEITGKSLNLALNSIVDSMGTADAAGSGVDILCIKYNSLISGDPTDLSLYTEEELQNNINIYNKIINWYETGQNPVIAFLALSYKDSSVATYSGMPNDAMTTALLNLLIANPAYRTAIQQRFGITGIMIMTDLSVSSSSTMIALLSNGLALVFE